MQAVCAHYAKLYNEHDPPLKVEYAKSWILKVRDHQRLPPTHKMEVHINMCVDTS